MVGLILHDTIVTEQQFSFENYWDCNNFTTHHDAIVNGNYNVFTKTTF